VTDETVLTFELDLIAALRERASLAGLARRRLGFAAVRASEVRQRFVRPGAP